MSLQIKKSVKLYKLAQRLMPGGVNSPVRSFKAVGGTPPFIAGAKGAYVFDVDGNRYIDYVSSWGPLILGHAHPDIVEAIKEAAERGTSYGAPHEKEIELAKLVTECVPSVDMVRMVNSGTEALMSAIRVARAYTKRDLIVKFEGCYHGHADYLLVKAGSGATTFGAPSSPGVPSDFTKNTLLARYNDLPSVERLFAERGRDIACVVIEPVAGNMGVVTPKEGFLEGLRKITQDAGALLIFDEVISGFRLGLGGAQEMYDVSPDLTCLGKIIGGGLPVGAFGGRQDIMEMVAPLGPVYQAGTLSGNPLAMAAGVAAISKLREKGTYERLEKLTHYLVEELRGILKKTGIEAQINSIGSMFTVFFTDSEVVDYDSALTSSTDTYAGFFRDILESGVMFPPSQFEACFLSLAHTEEDLEITLRAAYEALRTL